MFEDDRSYYQYRTATEIERARQATQPCAAKAHYALPEAYLDKLASLKLAEPASA